MRIAGKSSGMFGLIQAHFLFLTAMNLRSRGFLLDLVFPAFVIGMRIKKEKDG